MSDAINPTQLRLPMLPMREDIIYPGMTVPFFIGRKQSMEAVENAVNSDRRIFVVTQIDTAIERPEKSDLFEVGTIGNVLQIMRLPNGTLKALFEAKSRGRLIAAELDKDHYAATVEPLPTLKDTSDEIRELAEKIKEPARYYIKENKKNPDEIDIDALLASPPDELADKLAPLLNASREIKQSILEQLDPRERLERVCQEMEEESAVRKLEKRLKDQVRQSIGTSHREGFLQDQLKAVQKELGQSDDMRDDFDDYERQIKEAKMPESVDEVAKKELKKLRLMSPMSAEANVGRNYLDWLVSLPWSVRTEDNFDLHKAQLVLDEDHYAMEKVKEQIIEYLAVSKLKRQLKGPILCFMGPPGVGKTSLAKSIARALGRNFARMRLGGIRDEAEIRG
ncbi:MAG: LON peptidase substrate-binding domain-containing protein, partial [SAR324 cluster bacterium]|nr:LON peptidase substrate-binding domain-containing protein [SAR324 cluster bacterium]